MNVIEYLKGLLGAEKEEGPVGIRIAAVSHKGKVRGNNEDNFYVMGTVLPLLHEGTEGILEFQVEPEGQIRMSFLFWPFLTVWAGRRPESWPPLLRRTK